MSKQNIEVTGKFRSTTKGNPDWYFGGGEDAWINLAEARAGVPIPIREGKTVGIWEGSEIIEYIWYADTSDEGLVVKYPSPFSETQEERLRDLVYRETIRNVSVNRSTLEKGLLTDVVWNWNIDLRDDTVITAEFEGVDISGNLVGNQTFNIKDTTSKNLYLIVDRKGASTNLSQGATSYFYSPQYEGKISTDEPLATYVGLSGHSKIISSSTNLSLEVTLNDEHLFFICNSSSKNVRDNLTGFSLSLGEWDSTTAFLIKKPFNITLADGTIHSSTLYRTREKKTQTLNISLI
jgi:hypothetical protein